MLAPHHLSKLALLGLTLVAATGSGGADRAIAAATVKIGGTGSALGDMTLLADAYMRAHPGSQIVVLPSLGSGGGIKALRAGAIDVSLTTDPLSADESAAGLTALPYAKTPLAFATRPETPVDAVTSAWLSDVYRGTVMHWPDGKPIRLVLRPAYDSDMKILFGFSGTLKKAMEAALERPGLLIEDTAQAAVNRLAQLSGSLGSATFAQINSEQVALKLLAFDGVAPSAEALVSGRYPLIKTFYYVTKADASAAARDLIAFLGSAEAATILRKTGNVTISDAPRP
jgi:phosphate transport system substrate-binding protein